MKGCRCCFHRDQDPEVQQEGAGGPLAGGEPFSHR